MSWREDGEKRRENSAEIQNLEWNLAKREYSQVFEIGISRIKLWPDEVYKHLEKISILFDEGAKVQVYFMLC